MNIRHPLFPSLAASLIVLGSIGAFTTASAQGLTRAQVREQLIEAQANGSQYVTDSSYPDVSPVFAQQAARAKAQQQRDGMGAPMQGTSDAGAPRTACVGPVSFCNLYSGS
ncbi:DUF4148 domain-containing protein [Paraburkholderia lycopersici]|uniref:DUF4148 domain-containing protein n=1 Tax=Paraburkholderia lycopersici TaxID=416944 RepID=A0A1G6TL13_9BURK|nr:DUF4148 domain-containing protein [Paraburkholderia lycopersici]SDD29719.1 protein of unknown function [Paraburkholderia lycopersici]